MHVGRVHKPFGMNVKSSTRIEKANCSVMELKTHAALEYTKGAVRVGLLLLLYILICMARSVTSEIKRFL